MDNEYNVNDEVMFNGEDWIVNAVHIYIEKFNDDTSLPNPDEPAVMRIEYDLIANRVAGMKLMPDGSEKIRYKETFDCPEEKVMLVTEHDELMKEAELRRNERLGL